MDCENALELLSAALDGELTAQQQAQLDEHLAQCPSCRALQAELAGLHEACAQLDVAAPEGLKEQIMAHLPGQSAKNGAVYWRRWGAMAAAIALVALMAWQVPRFITQPTAERTADTVTMDVDEAEAPMAAENAPVDIGEAEAPTAAENAPMEDVPLLDGINGAARSSALTDGVDAFDFDAADAEAPAKAAAKPVSDYRAASAGSTAKRVADAETTAKHTADAEVPETYAGGGSAQTVQGDAEPVTTAGAIAATQADAPDGAAPSPEAMPFMARLAPVNSATTDEVMETAPETGAGNVPAEPRETLMEDTPGYCGVLTLEAYHPALDRALSVVEADGMARYTLSAEAFAQLVAQLNAEALPFTLSVQDSGADRFDAPGLVLVPLD